MKFGLSQSTSAISAASLTYLGKRGVDWFLALHGKISRHLQKNISDHTHAPDLRYIVLSPRYEA